MKSNLYPVQLVDGGSLAADLISPVLDVRLLDNIAIEIDVTGSATGTMLVQLSVSHNQDNQGNVSNAGGWVTILSQALVAGAPSPILFELTPTAAPWLRVMFDHVSHVSTPTADIYVSGKSV